MKVGIVNYGMGNVFSVENTLTYLGVDNILCSQPEELYQVDKIILPGVGAFKDCMNALHTKNFYKALNDNVLVKKKEILGICLGMQIMATTGFEGEETKGLGWIQGEVVKMHSLVQKTPNIGWEEIEYNSTSKLYKAMPKTLEFYFIHSYAMQCTKDYMVTGSYAFDDQYITASIEHENIYGTQYHPEKSSDLGKDILLNFID
jgi:imidazole glycerol-phosphate synthase subunit HisH